MSKNNLTDGVYNFNSLVKVANLILFRYDKVSLGFLDPCRASPPKLSKGLFT